MLSDSIAPMRTDHQAALMQFIQVVADVMRSVEEVVSSLTFARPVVRTICQDLRPPLSAISPR